MSKKLDVSRITNELEESSFFHPRRQEVAQPVVHMPSLNEEKQEVSPALKKETELPITDHALPQSLKEGTSGTVIPRYHDTKVSRHHDTMTPRYHDTVIPEGENEMLESVRKSVKQIGKEPATQRLTLEEKQALKTIEFTYGQQGIITNGNEIIRIATNYIIRDYQKNGEASILAKVLKLLNA
ncbi:hypothetical protein [Dictyobacter formicarum]|uniref:Uncharacterized protein n=1 Tax=Dictyobacter formicarum TaxID=2778368 RepID=A0ABQ3VGA2_9CHLR|nr:hypothetical protein [Dictyobacter formicarum]GHO85214.1 hypothetical protein KSZ_32200 [Dictyobacter formicarum]